MKITNQEKNILISINSFLKKHGMYLVLEKGFYQTRILSFDNADSDFISNKPQIRYCFILKSLNSSIEFNIWKRIDDLFFNDSSLRQSKQSLFQFLTNSKFNSKLKNFGKNLESVMSVDELELRLTAQGYLK